MNKNDYIIRLERKEAYREVENLVRESFWNVYRPGCLEHYVLNRLRDDPAFVPELDVVMEKDGELIGQNMFLRSVIRADDGREIPSLTMGPICIAPKYKGQGYGKLLLDYCLDKAARLGYGVVCFEGNIDFYGKCGFTYASRYGIRYHYCLKNGINEALFKVRILKNLFKKGPAETYNFYMGVILCHEVGYVLAQNPPKVVIGGKKQFKESLAVILGELTDAIVVPISEEEVDVSSAMGMIRIYEYA